jgi:hypothetical protein
MSLSHSPQISLNGLVLCLDAANRKSYPGSGTTWTDLSGNGNNGTLVNGVGYNSSNLGSLSFDGVNDYIDTAFTYVNNNDYTMGCWINTSVTQLCGLIGIRRQFTDTNWFQSNLYITGDVVAGISGNFLKFDDFNFDNGPPKVYPAQRSLFLNTESITTGTWRYIVISSDSIGARMYVDGQLKLEDNTSPSPTRFEPANFLIGAAGNYPSGLLSGYHYNGQMSGVSFYTRALTAQEIQQNFNALKGRFGLT